MEFISEASNSTLADIMSIINEEVIIDGSDCIAEDIHTIIKEEIYLNESKDVQLIDLVIYI